jgi:hypothetical protein
VTGSCASPVDADPAPADAPTWNYCDSSGDGDVTFFADLLTQYNNTGAVGAPACSGPQACSEVDTQGNSPSVPDQQVTFFADILQCYNATAAAGGETWSGDSCP